MLEPLGIMLLRELKQEKSNRAVASSREAIIMMTGVLVCAASLGNESDPRSSFTSANF